MGPRYRQQGWAPPPRDPAGKGVFGALFDLDFNHMVTTKADKVLVDQFKIAEYPRVIKDKS
ncbi:hypothetical protein AB0C21_29030 [Spirillospora sp. NPDC049024]